jgi:hypothetical protein
LESAAEAAGHLCPKMLKRELMEFHRIRGYLPEIKVIHVSPQCEAEISEEVEKLAKQLDVSISLAREGERLTI